MKEKNSWDKFYKETTLKKIPWQNAQDDYLKDIINSKSVKPGLALDLGCGTGIKSIFLAQKGFEVTGFDISKKAIEYAKENSAKSGLNIEFIAGDATDLGILGDRKFDFVLDWANLHGIPKSKRNKYVSEIYKHTKKGGKLLLRSFGKGDEEKNFVVLPMGKIHLLTKEDIENLYGNYFKIIKSNKVESSGLNPPGKFFYEFLMGKIEK